MCKLNHSFPVDFYALGVIAYEFMTGSVKNMLILETLFWQIKEIN